MHAMVADELAPMMGAERQAIGKLHADMITKNVSKKNARLSVLLTPSSAVYMRHRTRSARIQVKACRMVGAKPLPADSLSIGPIGTNLSEFRIKIQMSSAKLRQFCPGKYE